MKIIVPNYYKDFKCIADKCRHTCCKGWEVEIDDESRERFSGYDDIESHIETTDSTHFKLLDDERCPFLLESGFCDMILRYGEDMLCQTCTDHPRFRNFWSDRIEMGLGLVCEEAARIVLSSPVPMRLEVLESEAKDEPTDELPEHGHATGLIEENSADELPEDEQWLLDVRDRLLSSVSNEGPLARLREYLIFRHIPDALYDDRLEERIRFVDYFVELSEREWKKSDGTLDSFIEIVRKLSYDLEYDEEEKERILTPFPN